VGIFLSLICAHAFAQSVHVPIGAGWSRNQINTVIFRRNSLATHGRTQYAAYYDANSRVVLAKRHLGTTRWTVNHTALIGKTDDAHNSISIAVDGSGVLHLAWNHHNTPLQYTQAVGPGELNVGPVMAMLSDREGRVSYPEFYNLPNGDLLFLYRDGSSGNGNLVLNRFRLKTRKWERLHSNLIDGEGQRNAYWQAAVDLKGNIHVSWVWRETPDVATNHDLCYALSVDGGKTWQKSDGEKYALPVTARTADYVWRVPQQSELINQTSMTTDSLGRPYIATYWRPPGATVPQYFVIYNSERRWHLSQVTQRTTSFSLSGQGTRRIPISRPLLVVRSSGARTRAILVFRDVERGSRVSLAATDDLQRSRWLIEDLTTESVGMWEPTMDQSLWATRQQLHLFVQRVGQGEAETLEAIAPQMVSVLEWKSESRKRK
jgi:hypothetical protein